MFSKLYGFITIGVIEIGNLITHLNSFMDLLIFLLQVVIGVLTIYKLYKDVKANKYKSIKKSENELKKKKPFLFVLFEYLKNKF